MYKKNKFEYYKGELTIISNVIFVNRTITKVIIIHRRDNNSPHIREVVGYKVANNFVYLCLYNGGSEKEISCHLTMARSATVKLTRIWKDIHIMKTIKVRLVNFPLLHT